MEKRAPRLLVVDDHSRHLHRHENDARTPRLPVTLAHTADQAVEKAGKEEFDLMISDIGLA